MNKFFGTGVAMITPFNADGSVDYTGLKSLIDFLVEGGIDYLVSLGTTGESSTLTKDEKKQVWKFTVQEVAGRVPLVAGIGGNNTYEVISEIEKFDSTGFDSILSVSPFYNKPTQEGIYQHYKAIAEASPLPIILYNVPGRTGSNMTAETTLRLAHNVSNILGVKEASGNFDQFNKIVLDKPSDFLFISGDDSITLPMIAMGAAGLISVVGNAFPRILSDMVRLCLAGNFNDALPLHLSLLKATELCFAEGNPAGVKRILQQLGVCAENLRLPLVPVGKSTQIKIDEEIEKLKTSIAM